ncbi:MAG: BON domain-containing protein [Chloroflexi bacterium]|nr:BON domain-containing protein [Chloroflexota bacterium]
MQRLSHPKVGWDHSWLWPFDGQARLGEALPQIRLQRPFGMRRSDLLRHRGVGLTVLSLWLGGIAGVVGFYLLGRRRRRMALDRGFSLFRHGAAGLGRLGRYRAGRVRGLLRGISATLIRRRLPGWWSPPDEVILAHRVSAALGRTPAVPAGKINVNVEHGVAVLRGQVEHPEQMTALGEAACRVDGIRGVRNLLHLRGTPAPDTASIGR